ncbi:MAG: hypothetical protein V1738_04310 [Patescibacteria group bacterium]
MLMFMSILQIVLGVLAAAWFGYSLCVITCFRQVEDGPNRTEATNGSPYRSSPGFAIKTVLCRPTGCFKSLRLAFIVGLLALLGVSISAGLIGYDFGKDYSEVNQVSQPHTPALNPAHVRATEDRAVRDAFAIYRVTKSSRNQLDPNFVRLAKSLDSAAAMRFLEADSSSRNRFIGESTVEDDFIIDTFTVRNREADAQILMTTAQTSGRFETIITCLKAVRYIWPVNTQVVRDVLEWSSWRIYENNNPRARNMVRQSGLEALSGWYSQDPQLFSRQYGWTSPETVPSASTEAVGVPTGAPTSNIPPQPVPSEAEGL